MSGGHRGWASRVDRPAAARAPGKGAQGRAAAGPRLTEGSRFLERRGRPGVQAALQVRRSVDPYEAEADRVADQMVGSAASPAASAGSDSAHGEEEPQEGISGRLEGRIRSLQQGGRPLPADVRSFFEPRFGHDFSRIRVHTEPEAAQTAAAMQARAYTLDEHIFFGARRYAPETTAGRWLLAHELTHTVQQATPSEVSRRRLSGHDEEELEDDALRPKSAGGAIMRSPEGAAGAAVEPHGLGPVVQRDREGDDDHEDGPESVGSRTEEIEWSRTSEGIVEEDRGGGGGFSLLNFGIGKTGLKQEHEDFLRDKVYYGVLTLDPNARVTITGHADTTGGKKRNDRLAAQRAASVKAVLQRMGLPGERVDAVKGVGSREPVAANDTVAGRARNRGVRIVVSPWRPAKPVEELLQDEQKGMAPLIIKVDGFGACPFPETVKKIVEEAFRSIGVVRFDWEGKSASAEEFIDFDATTLWLKALGLSGTIYLRTVKESQICKVKGDPTTCESTFPQTADMAGRAIANAVVHEVGHAFGLDHVVPIDNYMWTPELHPLNAKKNKTYAERILLQRTLQTTPSSFNSSQLAHIVNRIKQKRAARKKKPNVVEFE